MRCGEMEQKICAVKDLHRNIHILQNNSNFKTSFNIYRERERSVLSWVVLNSLLT